jgi:hypothetical protein
MLSYTGAIKILGGEIDLGSLPLAEAMTEVVRLGGRLAVTPDSVRGSGCHNRTQRLLATHVVLVVTAFCEAAGECLDHALDWSNRVDQQSPRPACTGNFGLQAALKSMHLSNNLSDDTLPHALEPLIERMPDAICTFVRGPSGTTSVAYALIRVWVSSALGDDPQALGSAYAAAAHAVGRRGEWGEDLSHRHAGGSGAADSRRGRHH